MGTVILGTGMYVPPTVVTNDRLSRVMDTSDEWILQRTGISTRHYADLETATSDVAVPAAKQALANSGIDLGDVDYVVFATMTPDHYFPGSGPFLAKKLGLRGVPCLDIRQQCAGFVYGLQVADSLVRAGTCRRVLLVGAEVHAGFMPWKAWDVVLGQSDRQVPDEERESNTRFRDRTVLFGDGAGAVVLGAGAEGSGVIDTLVKTDGSMATKLWVDAGGSAYRPYFEASMQADGRSIPNVEGREVFKLAVTLMPQVVHEILGRNNLGIDQVDLLVMHQANLRINEAVQKRLELPEERVFNNIDRYGNTTAATIPIALHEALALGRIVPGNLVCLVALGSGLHWGAALLRF